MRQTVIISGYMTPDINALFNSNEYCKNIRGKVSVRNYYDGVITKIRGSAQHVSV